MKKLISLSVACVLLQACSFQLQSKKLDVSKAPTANHFIYYLPKTLLKLEVTYTKTTTVDSYFGVAQDAVNTFAITGAIKITPQTVANYSTPYYIDGTNGSKNPSLASTIDLTFNTNSTISAVDAEIESKTLTAISNLAEGAVTLAKMTAMPAGSDDVINSIKGEIEDEYKNIQNALNGSGSESSKDGVVASSETRIASLEKTLEKFLAGHTSTTTSTEETMTVIIDPSDATHFTETPGGMIYKLARLDYPTVMVNIDYKKAQAAAAAGE